VHDNTRVLVSAPDAPGDPVLISKTLPAEIIDQFSKALRLGSRSVS
jgi:ABC-type phosphate/phosphonate transport system substrate-binding protein